MHEMGRILWLQEYMAMTAHLVVAGKQTNDMVPKDLAQVTYFLQLDSYSTLLLPLSSLSNVNPSVHRAI